MKIEDPISIFWFRRDLRLEDNAGLYHALKSPYPVLPIFIFDTEILDKLEDRTDRRVDFIHHALQNIQNQLVDFGSTLDVLYGKPFDIWKNILQNFNVKEVYTNHDYEPYAQQRDLSIKDLLSNSSIPFYTFKDQCIFETNEVVKADGKPYTVFTPYSNTWKAKLTAFYLKSFPSLKYISNFLKVEPKRIPSLKEIGFENSDTNFPPKEVEESILSNYADSRNFPAIPGTSRLSVHLRFGTISIRHAAQNAKESSEVWLNELIWRDFYMMILYHFPHVVNRAFKPDYDHIQWRNNEHEFEAWCQGKTGYPLVDAGMREVNKTGFMHNRVRMVVASFLTKHLLIDWKWGEAYFAKKLLDFDLSANNGGWQWASGSGCDAAPYFRVFNPTLQTIKFDQNLVYIRKWIPEYDNPIEYPKPIVNHDFARKRAIEVYGETLKK